MMMVCLTASIFLFVLSIFHLIGGLHPAPVFLAGSSSIVTLFLYFLIRFKKCLFIPKLILTVFGLILLDLTWYVKFLSLGPVLYFIFAFGALVIWVWEGRSLIVMITLYFLNILALFLIEYLSTDFEFSYESLNQRSIDIYLSFFLYSILLISILVRVKAVFQQQRSRAVRSDNLKSAFLANMSHEFRTPLNSISGFSQLLEHENDPEKRKHFINIIRNSSDNLMNLVNELVDLSKIEADDVQLVFSQFSIKKVFIELLDFYSLKQLKSEKSRIKINYHLPDGDLTVFTDETRLKQILSNLLSNALKFTTSGSIDFSCSRVEDHLVFSVTDTGTGIPESDQGKIFERFTRFDYDGLNTDGAGIGLSIVEKMVELLNGRIWFNSVLGVGTSFFFSIPNSNNSV
jgi:signal transduction histidine kinase